MTPLSTVYMGHIPNIFGSLPMYLPSLRAQGIASVVTHVGETVRYIIYVIITLQRAHSFGLLRLLNQWLLLWLWLGSQLG